MGLNVLAIVEAFNPTSGHASEVAFACIARGLRYAVTKLNYASVPDMFRAVPVLELQRHVRQVCVSNQFIYSAA